MADTPQSFDVCIFGGGMVGAASACALAQLGLKVALIEPHLPKGLDASLDTLVELHLPATPDLRVSALNRHSIQLLDDLGALSYLRAMRYRNYEALSVWEYESAKTRFCAADVGEQDLGLFAENQLIQLSLLKSIKDNYFEQVTLFTQRATQIDCTLGQVSFAKQPSIQAQCLLGADGAQSQLRSSAGIGQRAWDYQQRANIILIQAEQAFPAETWQAFTPKGPRALLPMHDNFATLVWYADSEQSARIQGWELSSLKDEIIQHFPKLLPDFDILGRGGFALRRSHAKRYWVNRAVLVGDAAHTINPLAGQGVNLGFKDVAALKQAFSGLNFLENSANGLYMDKLSKAFREYESSRRRQNLLMMSTMDALYATFSNDIGPVKALRNIALSAAQKAGPIKNQVLKYAMGF